MSFLAVLITGDALHAESRLPEHVVHENEPAWVVRCTDVADVND